MRYTWLKRFLALVGLAAVAAGFVYALTPELALVDAARVEAGPMKVRIREDGVTRVRDIYAISAPIAGHLARTSLQEGDPVEVNRTVVARIHPLDPPFLDRRTQAELQGARDAARSGLGMAEMELQRAGAALKLAKQEQSRALKLFAPGIISASVLDRANSDVELQQATVESAKAAVDLRRAELASAEARLLQPVGSDESGDRCCIDVLAPVDGTVLAVLARSEQAVNAGTPIAEIGDVRDLEITVDLLSEDAVRIRPGTSAVVTDWGGGRALRATVRRINPAGFTKISALGIEEQRVEVALDLDDRDPRLGHDYRVFVELVVWDSPSCLQVPISSLFRNGEVWSVFTIVDGRARQVPVVLGHMNDETAEILAGLKSGDLVVLHPADTLADGAAVELRGT